MTPFCQADIEADEGFEAQAYPDPRSPLAKACEAAGLTGEQYRRLPNWSGLSGAPWTDGYGITGLQINADSTISQESANAWVAGRITNLAGDLASKLPWWPTLNDPRQDVWINMAYELGVSGLLAFRQALGYAAAGDYVSAAAQMLQSRWATQVPSRAQRMALQMKTGERSA